jgi:hypothetical protein
MELRKTANAPRSSLRVGIRIDISEPGRFLAVTVLKNRMLHPGMMRILVPVTALLAMAGFAAAQAPLISGINNAAPMATPSDSVARGELISIFGSNLTNGSPWSLLHPLLP